MRHLMPKKIRNLVVKMNTEKRRLRIDTGRIAETLEYSGQPIEQSRTIEYPNGISLMWHWDDDDMSIHLSQWDKT